jgi:hypothetical protein
LFFCREEYVQTWYFRQDHTHHDVHAGAAVSSKYSAAYDFKIPGFLYQLVLTGLVVDRVGVASETGVRVADLDIKIVVRIYIVVNL